MTSHPGTILAEFDVREFGDHSRADPAFARLSGQIEDMLLERSTRARNMSSDMFKSPTARRVIVIVLLAALWRAMAVF